MRLCPRPVLAPSHCAAIPFIGQTAERERWVDTGATMTGFDGHVYLSETAVREAARLLGMPTIRAHAEVQAALGTAEAELSALAAELEELRAYQGAVKQLLDDANLVAA